ncbi:MAG: hypothetical protein ACR2K9_03780 [Solirubrobacteraceae bacterium]
MLVIAPVPVDAAALRAAMCDEVNGAEVQVVAPASNASPLAFWVSDPDEAIGEAQEAQAQTVESLNQDGIEAKGDTGEGEPLVAIQDTLVTFPADKIVIFTRPEDESKYREDDVAGEAERRFGRPVVQHML